MSWQKRVSTIPIDVLSEIKRTGGTNAGGFFEFNEGGEAEPRSSKTNLIDQLAYAEHHASVDQSLKWINFRLVCKKEVDIEKLSKYQPEPLERSLLLYSSARCGGERMAKVVKKLCLLIFKEINAYLNNDILYVPQAPPRPSVYTPFAAVPSYSSPSSSAGEPTSKTSLSPSKDSTASKRGLSSPGLHSPRGAKGHASLMVPGLPAGHHGSQGERPSQIDRDSAGREVRAHNLCFDILNMGAHEALLRDEILCQLMKQTSGNPDKGSVTRGWKLIYLSLSAFPPSDELTPYIRAYITKHAPAKAEGSYGVDEVEHLALRSQIALGFGGTFALPRAMKTIKAPTFRRIKAVGSGNIRPLSFGEIYAPSKIAFEKSPQTEAAEQVQDSYGYTDIHTGIHESRIAGAPFQSFAIRSKKGFIPKLEKPNQDRAIWKGEMSGQTDRLFFGVFDGHGSDGHKISSWLIDNVPKRFDEEWSKNKDMDPQTIASDILPKLNADMLKIEEIDAAYSGSTGVMVAIDGKTLYTFNVGDSRAIMARRVGKGKKVEPSPLAAVEPKAAELALDYDYKAIPITRDHKPEDPEEKIRIEKAGGRCAYKDPTKPAAGIRVWKKDQDVPGLAVSRAFGDAIGRECGVMAIPECKKFQLTPEDSFIILASDGIWEFLDNQEVVDICCEAKDPEVACQELIEEASLAWQDEDESRDDITLIVIFLPGFTPRPPRTHVDDDEE
eukprot:gb/GEZN01002321.1/.p1 GENE.gb/GEZN01002321.1/~~gb/GEZN01002321.1/.p1  ORF type:complete len:724 (+),score=60.90 gb/GEZN01002321.1/:34-2205(+)